MNIAFSDGTNTNWSATDQDGQQLNNDATQQSWHYRRVDLSSYAGKSISNIYLVQESTTAAGNWDIYFTDIAIVFNRRQRPASLQPAEIHFVKRIRHLRRDRQDL